MTTKFRNKVEAGDIVAVRLMIANELMLDPRGDSFHEMLDYAASRLPNLFEACDDNGSYSTDEASWNEDYLSQVKSDLNYNFSKERLDYYERVAKNVLKDKAEELRKEEPRPRIPTSSRSERPSSVDRPRPSYTYNAHQETADSQKTKSPNPAYVGIAAGSAAITALGFCIAPAAAKIVLASVLASVGVAGVVVGGCLIYKDLKK